MNFNCQTHRKYISKQKNKNDFWWSTKNIILSKTCIKKNDFSLNFEYTCKGYLSSSKIIRKNGTYETLVNYYTLNNCVHTFYDKKRTITKEIKINLIENEKEAKKIFNIE